MMLPAPPPLIVAGMHRSGTSLVGSLLARAGVDMGEVIPADAANPTGYFEDRAFLALNRKVLAAGLRDASGGHPDWGWVESGHLNADCFAEYQGAASQLLRERDGAARPCAWKDPRATLLLDFWERAAGGARYLLLYRYPWDVADSVQRLGAAVFVAHPAWPYRIWAHYNERLLEFAASHRSQCTIVSMNAAVRHPERFSELLSDRLEIELEPTTLEQTIDSARFRTVGESDPLIDLVATVYPQCPALLRRLDQAADLPAAEPRPRSAGVRRIAPAAPPEVSIVVPCFNDGPFLVDVVASVERNAPAACELIVVDDGSDAPSTLDVLQTLHDAGYRVVRQEHRGLSAARNRGFEAASAPYVFPLDADNRLAPGFLEHAVRLLEGSPDLAVVHGDWREFGCGSAQRAARDFDLAAIVKQGNYIDACALIRKEAWGDVGGYDVDLLHMEDWEFWIRLGKRGWKFHRVPRLAFEYRVRPGSLSDADSSEFGEALDRCRRKHPEIATLGWTLRRMGFRYAGLRERILPRGTLRRRALGRFMNLIMGRA